MNYSVFEAYNVGACDGKLFFRDGDGAFYEVAENTISSSLHNKLNWNDGMITGQVVLFHIDYDDGTNVTYLYDPSRQKKERHTKPMFEQEGIQLELKASLYHSANKAIDDPINGNKPAQWRELAQQLDGFAHAHCVGRLVIGVNDDGQPIGLNSEVKDIHRTEDELRNYFTQVLGVRFTSTLTFDWRYFEDKLVLSITVPEWHNDIIPVFGTEFYLRIGSSNHKLRGQDLIGFIRNYDC